MSFDGRGGSPMYYPCHDSCGISQKYVVTFPQKSAPECSVRWRFHPPWNLPKTCMSHRPPQTGLCHIHVLPPWPRGKTCMSKMPPDPGPRHIHVLPPRPRGKTCMWHGPEMKPVSTYTLNVYVKGASRKWAAPHTRLPPQLGGGTHPPGRAGRKKRNKRK